MNRRVSSRLIRGIWGRRSWTSATFTALVLWTISAPAQPTSPDKSAVDTVRGAVEVVTNVRAKKDPRAEQQAIKQVSQTLFDWDSMAKQALGREWRLRTPEEQKEFVKLFAGLIEQRYLATIRRYNAEEIDYVAVGTGGEDIVRMNVRSKPPVRIDYRMRVLGKEWKIYDVVIKDVSVVQNYRDQFERILREGSYRELVARIRERRGADPLTP